jgi:hypothetical protein
VGRLHTMAHGDHTLIAAILKRLVAVMDLRFGPESTQVLLLPLLELYGAQFRAEVASRWQGREDGALIAALWSRPGDERIREYQAGDVRSPAARDRAFAEAMRLALAREPESLMVRYVDALHCAAMPDACGDPASAQQLVHLDADNAAHYVLAAHGVGSQEEVRALLGRGAGAAYYDDHFSSLFALYLRGVRDSGVEIPDILGGPIRSMSSLDDAGFFVSYYEFQLRPPFQFGPFVQICSKAETRSDRQLHSDCVGFFEKAFDSRGGLLNRRVGETMLRRLLDDPVRVSALVEDRRRYLWMLECPGVMEVTPGSPELTWEQLAADTAREGELAAFFLRAQRLGCGDGPSADWMPQDPERLLLPEQRSGAPS